MVLLTPGVQAGIPYRLVRCWVLTSWLEEMAQQEMCIQSVAMMNSGTLYLQELLAGSGRTQGYRLHKFKKEVSNNAEG